MKLNKTEVLVGFAHGAWAMALIGLWWGLALGAGTAALFALGGAGQKLYRRIGVPAAVAALLVFGTGKWLMIVAGLSGFAVLSIGYGLPSTQPPDAGSWLGRYVFAKLNLTPHNAKDELLANLIIRGGLLIAFVLPFMVANAI